MPIDSELVLGRDLQRARRNPQWTEHVVALRKSRDVRAGDAPIRASVVVSPPQAQMFDGLSGRGLLP